MKSLKIASLLIAALLLQSACSPKRDEPAEPTTPPAPDDIGEVRGKQDVTICIDSNQVDIVRARVKSDRKQGFGWKSHDRSYVVKFEDAHWGFTEPADSTVPGLKFVRVPSGANSRTFTLNYKLPHPDSTRVHDYEIGSGPPDGPAIIGGD